MKQQLLKPWLIFALIFLLVSGVIIRITEYQLPSAAHRIHAEVGSRYEAMIKAKNTKPIPDAENALPVYKEAINLMQQYLAKYPEKDGYFWDWKIATTPEERYHWEQTPHYVLSLPSQQFPEESLTKIRRCVDAYQPVLDKLHHAAALTIPETLWQFDEKWHRNNRMSPWQIRWLLHLEILLCILDNNESGAMEAFHTLAAAEHMRRTNIYYSMFGRGGGLVLGDEIAELIYFGLERNVFSEASLELLQTMIVPPHEVIPEDAVTELFIHQKQLDFWGRRDEERLSFWEMVTNSSVAPHLYDSWCWYKNRLEIQNATAALAGIQLHQRYLLGDAEESTAKMIKAMEYWYLGLKIESPFGQYDPFSMAYIAYYSNHSRSYWYWMERFRFLRIIIALGRYRLDHGAFPEDIHAINGYVPEKDLDIFTNQDFLYERTDIGWIIRQNKNKTNGYRKPSYAYPLGTLIDEKEFLIH